MGQQQLILLVLATVIVGIAIVVGIAAFTENSARANADAMMQDAVRMANDIQATIKKPDPFGGVDDFDQVTLTAIGYPNDGTKYDNLNGSFRLSGCTAGVGCIITGTDTVDAGSSPPAFNEIVVAVCGLRDVDITGAVMHLNEQTITATAPSCS